MKKFLELSEAYQKPLGTLDHNEDHKVDYKHVFDTIKPLTQKEKIHVNYYTGDDYENINHHNRNYTYNEYAAEQTKHIDSAIKKTKTNAPLRVWRGIRSPEIISNLKSGDHFTDKGFISTSTNPAVAKDFSGKHLISIHIPKGANALSTRREIRPNDNEHEVILPRNSKLKYVSSFNAGLHKIHFFDLLKRK